MSKVMRALRMLALAVVLVCLTAVPALADDYTYTVRVFGGNKGDVNGENMYTVSSDYAYGENCTLNKEWVKVNDSKYYVKGFRISGQDELCNESFKVTEDVDLVVAYGVKGAMVDYTINFVEYGTGNRLTSDAGRSSVTFSGKVGDKPVVAAEYISGYRPLYNNVTGTLHEGENVWNLEYVKIDTGTKKTTTTTTTTTTNGGTTTVNGGTTTTDGGTTTVTVSSSEETAEGTGTAAGTQEGTATEGADEEATDEETTEVTDEETEEEEEVPETQEILDMDNPLAGPGNSVTDDGAHDSTVGDKGLFGNKLFAAAAALGIAAALVLAFFLIKKRNEKKEA